MWLLESEVVAESVLMDVQMASFNCEAHVSDTI
jgi:hypothetical protein